MTSESFPEVDALLPLDEKLLRRRLLMGVPVMEVTAASGLDGDSGAYARIERVESVGSTNQYLLDALAAESRHGVAHGADSAADSDSGVSSRWPHLSVLTAEEQTGGRGRLGRSWASPKSTSLSTSVVLRPRLDPAHWGWLSMLAGRALVDTLRQDYGLDTESQRAVLKWPNDVQVTQASGAEKKISGILAAAVPGTRSTRAASADVTSARARFQGTALADAQTGPVAVVLGVGINVLLSPQQLPTDAATSVLIELHRARAEAGEEHAGRGLDSPEGLALLRTELLCNVLKRFAERLATVEDYASRKPEHVSEFLSEQITEVLSTIGQRVRVELPDDRAERGVANGLSPDGALQVLVTEFRTDPEEPWQPCEPRLNSFSAGDVVHLRPSL